MAEPAVVYAPGRLDIALVDLAQAVNLDSDSDGDGEVRWGEVLDRQVDVQRYFTSQILIIMAGDLECRVD